MLTRFILKLKHLQSSPDNVLALTDSKTGRRCSNIDEVVMDIMSREGRSKYLKNILRQKNMVLREKGKKVLEKLQKALDELNEDSTTAEIQISGLAKINVEINLNNRANMGQTGFPCETLFCFWRKFSCP